MDVIPFWDTRSVATLSSAVPECNWPKAMLKQIRIPSYSWGVLASLASVIASKSNRCTLSTLVARCGGFPSKWGVVGCEGRGREGSIRRSGSIGGRDGSLSCPSSKSSSDDRTGTVVLDALPAGPCGWRLLVRVRSGTWGFVFGTSLKDRPRVFGRGTLPVVLVLGGPRGPRMKPSAGLGTSVEGTLGRLS